VDWEVLDDYSGSDHNYIAFNLIPYSRALNDNLPVGRGEHLGWASRKVDHAALSRKLDEGPPFLEEPASADDAAEVLNNYLVNVCDSCMPREAMEPANGRQFIGGTMRLPILEPNASRIGAYISEWLRDKVLMAVQRKELPSERHPRPYAHPSVSLRS